MPIIEFSKAGSVKDTGYLFESLYISLIISNLNSYRWVGEIGFIVIPSRQCPKVDLCTHPH